MRGVRWERWLHVARGLFGAVALLGAPRAALACGGCFHRGGAGAPVVAHRMAFALSEGRTVLWDQFQYAGAAEEFSWVLPITPGAYLELSTDAWFAALEAVTAVRVQAPFVDCASRGRGCGDERNSDILVSDSARRPDVTVLARQSIGPYDTVTLRSDSGDALTVWLVQNGFFVPEDVVPIIAQYVREGADFIALKLLPTAGVQQMQPVRVITPNGPPILPLRMVAAGAAESVDIVLYTIGAQRFHMPDFVEVSVDPKQVRYDFALSDSNYLGLRQQALSFNGGQSFLTAYVRQGFFSEPPGTNPVNAPLNAVNLYVNQVIQEGGLRRERDQCLGISARARTKRLVVPDCAPLQEPGCTPPGDDELAFSELTCAEFQDIAVALLGQRPEQTWLTRLELRLPRSALTADCVLLPSSDQSEVSNLIAAEHFDNPPCDLPVFSSSLSGGRPRELGGWLVAGLFAGALLRRRARQRARA